MKKLVSIFVAVFYLTVTAGLAVHIHYCHGEIQSVQVYGEPDDRCCEDDCGDSCDRCFDDVQFIQFKSGPTLITDSRMVIQPLLLAGLIFEDVKGCRETTTDRPFVRSTADRLPRDLPAWLLFCSPIYYG